MCGVDEAGRGPIAGPVYAAAVILDPARRVNGLADSKVLDAGRREVLAARIKERAVAWAVAFATVEEIDRINILRASLWALARAVKALPVAPKLVFVDGNQKIDCGCECVTVVSGDALVQSVAAASIVAKVTRDRLMMRLGLAHPGNAHVVGKIRPFEQLLFADACLGCERLAPLHRAGRLQQRIGGADAQRFQFGGRVAVQAVDLGKGISHDTG